MDDFDRNHALIDKVEGVEHGRVDTTTSPRPELIATRDDATVELCSHHCHGVLNVNAASISSAVMREIGCPAAECAKNGARIKTMKRRPPGTPRLDEQKRRLLVCSFVIAVGLVLVILGFQSSVTGRKALALPPTIEDIDPVRGAVRVPAQTEVFVDLLAGYTGVLIIDGIELKTVDRSDVSIANPVPGQQVSLPATTIYERGNATLTFVPTKGAPIESFVQGTHTATVVFWKVLESRQRSQSYTWTFSVF
jgi:hypothetical protein